MAALAVLALFATGCVRIPVSRSRAPIPEAPIEVENLNPILAVTTVVAGDQDSEDATIQFRGNGDDPLQRGEELRLGTPAGTRNTSVRRANRDYTDSIGYFSTSRGFETPPIDPLGQTSVFDRPLYQR
jgi:hypothetical protein